MVPKKIMFAISDTGGGHRSAAASLIAALNEEDHVTCTITDFLRATQFPILKKAPEIYDYCSKKHLWLNNLFFRNTNSISRINALTRIVYTHARHRIDRELKAAQPDIVVAVHPLVTGLLRMTRTMTKAQWPIITVVTDMVTLHASWATPGADLYLVPTQEAFDFLVNQGIPPQMIVYTGFPIHPKFINNKKTQQESRQELGIASDPFTVLVTGGGVGAGNMEEWINSLEENCPDKQLLIVTGHNKDLYQALMKHSHSSPHLHVYGFVDNMETLMAASDMIITKAGPGTIMEGIVMHRPLIVTEAVGYQETGNIDYVLKNNLGHHCSHPLAACDIINHTAAKIALHGNHYTNEGVITDGSHRIARIILEQIQCSPSPYLSAPDTGA